MKPSISLASDSVLKSLPCNSINKEQIRCRNSERIETVKNDQKKLFRNHSFDAPKHDRPYQDQGTRSLTTTDKQMFFYMLEALFESNPRQEFPFALLKRNELENGEKREKKIKDKYELWDLVDKMRHPKTGIPIQNRMYFLITYDNCFIGKEGVDWLTRFLSPLSRYEAVRIFQNLEDKGILRHVANDHPFLDSDYFYRFMEDEEGTILNLHKKDRFVITTSPIELSTILLQLIAEIFQENQTEDEFLNINITKILESPKFSIFKRLASHLGNLKNLEILSKEEKVCFWLNIYNILSHHVLLNMFATGTPVLGVSFLLCLSTRYQFFRNAKYFIAGNTFSLDDVEHGVLRGNLNTPIFFYKKNIFPDKDPRRFFSLSKGEIDNRVHFAMNCGTKSSPPLMVFCPTLLDKQFQYLTQHYLKNNVTINTDQKKVILPPCLKWYQSDFADSETQLLKIVGGLLGTDDKASMIKKEYGVQYHDYDWRIQWKPPVWLET